MLIAAQIVKVLPENEHMITIKAQYMSRDSSDPSVKEIAKECCIHCNKDYGDCQVTCMFCDRKGCHEDKSIVNVDDDCAHIKCALDEGYVKCSGHTQILTLRCRCMTLPSACPVHCNSYTDRTCPQGHPSCLDCQGNCLLCQQ